MQAVINPLYPNRVQVQLSSSGSAPVGPLATADFIPFDPRIDLELYFDGLEAEVISFTYDALNDQYLLFTRQVVPVSGIVQVIYHMPVDPFTGPQGILPGFALIASAAFTYDPVFDLLAVNVPVSTNPGWVYFQPPAADAAAYGWNDGGYGDGDFGGSEGTSANTTVTVTGFGHAGFGSGGFGGKTVTNPAAAVTVTGFGADGFGSGGYGGHTPVVPDGTIVTGFGAGGFGHGGFGGHTPPSDAAATGGYGVGPFGGETIETISTPNGQVPVFYIPNLAPPGSQNMPPVSVDFYALGLAEVRLQSSDASFDSGFVPSEALYGTINVTGLTLGEQIVLEITGYDDSGNVILQNGTAMELTFALVSLPHRNRGASSKSGYRVPT